MIMPAVAAMAEGRRLVASVTSPFTREIRLPIQLKNGGLMLYGLPLAVGKIQCPSSTISRLTSAYSSSSGDQMYRSPAIWKKRR